MTQLRYLENVASLKLDVELCVGCGLCPQVCPHGLLVMTGGKAAIVDLDLCMECGACAQNCPVAALQVEAGVGCASALIHSWLTGEEPNCYCAGSC